MFDQFTERAKKVMILAYQESQMLSYDLVGPEHILLGLIKEDSGIAASVLKGLGFDLLRIRAIVAATARIKNGISAKDVVERAIDSARNLNHKYVGTEHLLLGLISLNDDMTSKILSDFEVAKETIKNETLALLGSYGDQAFSISPITEQDKIEALAVRGHAGQKRSDGTDYIEHPRSVRNRLVLCGIKNKVVLTTALFHDLLEDTTITEKEIEEVAGLEVLEAVKQLTNKVSNGTSFATKTAQMLQHARHYNDVAKRVKLADRYDNLADAIWTWQPERVKRYAKAGLQLLDVMEPFPEDVAEFASEARRFFSCII